MVETGAGPLRARISTGGDGPKLQAGEEAIVFVRPEAVKFANGADGLDNKLRVRIVQEEFEGSFRHVVLEGPGGQTIKMSLINQGETLGHEVGSEQTVGFRADLAVALARGPLARE